ncbi:hypothetical protein P1J78_25025 [Psychromarinibacter sp. C21-152]|uniref:Uncharacterized protein n=1 Tax=Psychromarinibacter sediminicola TaxID=3033385 RepID=A0AAE3NZV3_9RHOB|nr:hypothetical protein [Psychromarinibacter sediminicola]MDF0603975.1 hypothetical protein [Psychromarinibacter sediminicola]
MNATIWFFFSAICGGLVFRLVYERAEEIAFWLIRQQCKLLPDHERDETEAEWLSVISEVNGGAWKILNAFGFSSVSLPAYARSLDLERLPTDMNRLGIPIRPRD